MSEINAYPLSWPTGKPRTPQQDRKHGRFGTQKQQRFGLSEITINQAVSRIMSQVRSFTKAGKQWRINPDDVVISSNLKVRLDGLPYSNQRTPDDSGVAVYFSLDDAHQCIAVDSYIRIADNLAAVAAVLEALRTLERHGSGLMEAAFTGFTALPDPNSIQELNWRDVLDYRGGSLKDAKLVYRKLATRHHPDKGGDSTVFGQITRAFRQAEMELKNA